MEALARGKYLPYRLVGHEAPKQTDVVALAPINL